MTIGEVLKRPGVRRDDQIGMVYYEGSFRELPRPDHYIGVSSTSDFYIYRPEKVIVAVKKGTTNRFRAWRYRQAEVFNEITREILDFQNASV